jgi:hypothetical protein
MRLNVNLGTHFQYFLVGALGEVLLMQRCLERVSLSHKASGVPSKPRKVQDPDEWQAVDHLIKVELKGGSFENNKGY